MPRLLCALFALWLCTPVLAENTPAPAPVVLDATEIHTLTTPDAQAYRLQVRLPPNYSQDQHRYPVILKIDGQWDFPLAASVVNNLYFDGQMPQPLVIGIDWMNTQPNLQAVRMRDLSPVAVDGFNASGQAEAFSQRLAQDILPQLHQRFRTNGQVFLVGGSLGANFVTYALLAQPQAFSGAVAIAGNYGTSLGAYSALIQRQKGQLNLLNKRLYLAVGTADVLYPEVNQLAQQLQKAQLTGLQLKYDTLAGYGHSGMNVPGYAAGYQFMFARPRLAFSPKQLNAFTGTYTRSDGAGPALHIQATAQGLVAELNGVKRLLHAQSPQVFYYEGEFFNLHFTPAGQGYRLQLHTVFGQSQYQQAP